MSLPNPCIWCPTEPDSFRRYWRNRSFVIIIIIIIIIIINLVGSSSRTMASYFRLAIEITDVVEKSTIISNYITLYMVRS